MDGWTDRQTDGPTDGLADGQTHLYSYEDASKNMLSHPKNHPDVLRNIIAAIVKESFIYHMVSTCRIF